MSTKDDKPLSLEEAADFLDLAIDSIYKLTSKGILPHYKPTGKKLYFRRSELEAWVFQTRIGPPRESLVIAKNSIGEKS